MGLRPSFGTAMYLFLLFFSADQRLSADGLGPSSSSCTQSCVSDLGSRRPSLHHYSISENRGNQIVIIIETYSLYVRS